MDVPVDSETLHPPPLPTLKRDKYFWVASITLPSWAGFQFRQGRNGTIDEAIISDGSIKLTVAVPEYEPTTPSTEQVTAFEHLMEQHENVRDSVLQAIVAEYPTWRESYKEVYEADEFGELMPQIQEPEQLKDLIRLSYAHIHTIAKDGMAYVGYQFDCSWEDEHGLGAMTHAGRVIEVGYADASFEWIAKRDAEKGQ